MDVWAYMGGDYMYMCRLSQGILHACCALVRRTQVSLSKQGIHMSCHLTLGATPLCSLATELKRSSFRRGTSGEDAFPIVMGSEERSVGGRWEFEGLNVVRSLAIYSLIE